MNGTLDTVAGEKLELIVKTLSGKFNVPLAFLDINDKVLFNINAESTHPANCTQSLRQTASRTVPIRFMTDVIGKLAVPATFQKDEQVASAIAYCLENFLKFETEIEDLSSEIVRVYEELSLMYSLSSKLGSEMDVDAICRRVLEETGKFLSPANISIMLHDAHSNRLTAKFSMGKDADIACSFTAESNTGFLGDVLQQGHPVTVCDIERDCSFRLPYPAKSVLFVPLMSDDRPIGLLLACDKLSGEEFWSRELKLMGMFASEIAASIRKAQLYEEISKMFICTVEAFASAIDAKDPYTYGHSRRVARISVAICDELGMPKTSTRLVELAAFLHDIGKIGTPESILHKPGALQPHEFEKIKEHPAKGAEILSNIGEFSEIIKWIKHHHEWYDGNGYPDQIAAEDIPIEARIITIADAFDAMTSDRPYRKGMPHPEVIKIMEGFTRSQFDPDILTAFKRLMEEGKINL